MVDYLVYIDYNICMTKQEEVVILKDMYWLLMNKASTFNELKKLQMSLESQIRGIYGL